MSAADEVVATWSEHRAIGHPYEDLRAGRLGHRLDRATLRRDLYPGDGDPDYSPICSCPGPWPRQFCMECAGCFSCG
ncbi:hypothetical protein [Streptomyces sp. NPDC054865]